MFRFTIRDVLWLMLVVGVASGWYAQSTSWTVQRNRLLGERDILKEELSTEEQKHLVELRKADARHRTAERRADTMNQERMKVVKVAAELKKELGLQPPASGNNNSQLQRLWEANQIFALENKVLKSELEAIKAQVAEKTPPAEPHP